MRQFIVNALVVLALPVLGWQYEQDRVAKQQAELERRENEQKSADEKTRSEAEEKARQRAAARLAEANKQIESAVQASNAAKATGRQHIKAVFDAVPDLDLPGHVSFALLAKAPKALTTKAAAAELPAEIAALDGKQVTITGFLLVSFPVEPILEAVLAKNPWDECCLGTPPTLFDSVEVKMRKDRPLKKARIRIGSLTGTLRTKPIYGEDGNLQGLYVLENAFETELSVANSAATGSAAAATGATPAADHGLYFLLAMPVLLALAVVNNLIPSRGGADPAGAADVSLSTKKFSIED